MTTVVNTPAAAPAPVVESGGNSFFIGIVLLIAFVSILLYFGIPALKRMGPLQVNISVPQVTMPDKVNVTTVK